MRLDTFSVGAHFDTQPTSHVLSRSQANLSERICGAQTVLCASVSNLVN